MIDALADSYPALVLAVGICFGAFACMCGVLVGYRLALRRADPLSGSCRCWLLNGGARHPGDAPEFHHRTCPVYRRHALRLLQAKQLMDADQRSRTVTMPPYDHEAEDAMA